MNYSTLFSLGTYNTGILLRANSPDCYVAGSVWWVTPDGQPGTGASPFLPQNTLINYFPLGAWTYVKLLRDTGVLKLYIDNVLRRQFTYNGTISSGANGLWIGAQPLGQTESIDANFDDFRLVDGQALYDAAVPSTAALNTL